MDQNEASRARKEAGKALATIQLLVEQLQRYRRPLTAGKLQEVLKTCGRHGCKCERGGKHASQYLYVSRGGPLQRLFVPKGEVAAVRECSERYGSFRATRAALGHAYQELLSQVDALEAALTEPYHKVSDREGCEK